MKIHLKTIKKIKDSTVNRDRVPKEVFIVSEERLEQMKQILGRDFGRYFEITKTEVEKKVIEPTTEIKKRQPRKKKTNEKD
jgi:hypothetical protein